MRILFCGRLDLLDVVRGDTIQALETRTALEALGVEVEINPVAQPCAKGFDLIHIFNTPCWTLGLQQLRAAKAQGCPVALSTIFWDRRAAFRSVDMLKYEMGGQIFGTRVVRTASRLVGLGSEGSLFLRRRMRQMLAEADVLLPNSVAELEILIGRAKYNMARAKAFIVPNAASEASGVPALSESEAALLASLPGDYVMEAAYVECTKGQLQLLRAATKWCPEIPLVFVGGYRPGSRYFDEFKRQRRRRANVYYLGSVSHQALPHFYARAKVHALPSLRDSPGLATLEAALAGCNCVVGIHAPVQEYFGQDAWICDPADVDSIGRALRAAWDSPKRGQLKARVRREFTWARAAEETMKAYEYALAR